jgi:gelsolin
LLVDLADQELVRAVERPKSRVVRVIEGFETVMFRSKFESWPQTTNVTVSEDGRGKVAGQQLNYLIDLILVSCFHS